MTTPSAKLPRRISMLDNSSKNSPSLIPLLPPYTPSVPDSQLSGGSQGGRKVGGLKDP